jgi:transposase-like protein
LKKHQGYGDTFFIGEVFVKIDGKQHYLRRAVDQDGEIVDVFRSVDVTARPLNASSNDY